MQLLYPMTVSYQTIRTTTASFSSQDSIEASIPQTNASTGRVAQDRVTEKGLVMKSLSYEYERQDLPPTNKCIKTQVQTAINFSGKSGKVGEWGKPVVGFLGGCILYYYQGLMDGWDINSCCKGL